MKLCCGKYRVQILVGAQYFSLPECPDRLKEPPSLLFSGQWGLFRRAKVAMLTIYHHLLLTLRISSVICLPLMYSFMACIGATYIYLGHIYEFVMLEPRLVCVE
jgi:hypothetical protein